MRRGVGWATLVGVAMGVAGMLAVPTFAEPEPTPTLIAMAEHRFVETFGAGTPKVAVLWGDPLKPGDSGFLIRFPPGAQSPPHWHSSSYWAVTISGTMRHWPATSTGADAKALPAGSYQMMPARLAHVSKCDPGAECIVMVHVIAPFDAKLVTPAR